MRRTSITAVAIMMLSFIWASPRLDAAPPPAAAFHGLVPARLLDTRPGASTIDGQSQGTGAVAAGSITNVTISGRAGVPSNAGAVALNVAAVNPIAASFVTVWPAGSTRPTASNLNLQPGITTPNMVIVPLGINGQISLYNDTGTTDLLVDILGWYPTGNSFTGLVPARLLDTRPGAATIDGQSQGAGAVDAGSITNLTVRGRASVPTNAGAVALNVTAVNPTSASFVTVWPAGESRPTASNLNLQPGITTPNMVIVSLGASGQISLYNDTGITHLLVDILGWYPTGDNFTGLNPTRLLDTRQTTGPVGAGSITNLTVRGGAGIPATAGAVALNVTAVNPTNASFVTVWPAGATKPTASNLNLQPGVTTPNMVIVPLGTNGQISLYNDTGTTHLLVDVLGWFPTTINPATTTRISVTPDGTQANDFSRAPAISGDGRYLAFMSSATNLVNANDKGVNLFFDVFVADRHTGIITKVTSAVNGAPGNETSQYPSISGDGRFITYESDASNLVTGDTNGVSDIFLYDASSRTTSRITVNDIGTQSNNYSAFPSIGGDGRFIAYESDASNLVSGDTNGVRDIFLYDTSNGTTTRITAAGNGTQANGDSFDANISADNRFIAYESVASNLVSGDTNGKVDIFLYDRSNGTTSRVSIAGDGTQANGNSTVAKVSGDGRTVAFQSTATNLVVGDTNGQADIFLHDRVEGTTTKVTLANNGAQANKSSESPAISADGRYVSYTSLASNLVSDDTNGEYDVFLYDRTTRATTRVSVASNGAQGVGSSYSIAINSDGRFICFQSATDKFVADDTPNTDDVFVRDQGST